MTPDRAALIAWVKERWDHASLSSDAHSNPVLIEQWRSEADHFAALHALLVGQETSMPIIEGGSSPLSTPTKATESCPDDCWCRKTPRADSGWKPIDTAPRNGTWVWVVSPRIKGSGWSVSAFKFDVRENKWFAGSGWWHAIDHMCAGWLPMSEQPPCVPAPPPSEAE